MGRKTERYISKQTPEVKKESVYIKPYKVPLYYHAHIGFRMAVFQRKKSTTKNPAKRHRKLISIVPQQLSSVHDAAIVLFVRHGLGVLEYLHVGRMRNHINVHVKIPMPTAHMYLKFIRW